MKYEWLGRAREFHFPDRTVRGQAPNVIPAKAGVAEAEMTGGFHKRPS